MPKTVLVSLVSDQTIPNVEFILYMCKQHKIDQFLFVTTKYMEKKENREWIIDAADLHGKNIQKIIVNPFSYGDIIGRLDEISEDEPLYVVNLTGGTKMMSLACFEFFKNFRSEIYYLPGKNNYIKIHPGKNKAEGLLEVEISLKIYLKAYGFEITKKSEPLRDFAQAKRLLSFFLKESYKVENAVKMLDELRKRRGKKNTTIESIKGLGEFLQEISFMPEKEGKITKYECKYLTGEWLEEYLYFFILHNFKVAEQNIALGIELKKVAGNEFDVLLVKNNKLYIFECKTSVYMDLDKGKNFISETIYKSDSLRSKFGLFAQTTIVTLSDLSQKKFAEHRKRANVSNVKLIDRSSFTADQVLRKCLEEI